MTYQVEVLEVCQKRVRKLSKELQERFLKRAKKLADNPKQGKPLRNELHGYWELYFEKSFRILYTIDEESQKVVVEAIKHKDQF